MEKLEKYQNIIQKELEKFAQYTYANAEKITNQLIINKEKNQFILLSLGWDNQEYHHNLSIHIEIKNTKIWIHEDLTDFGIAKILKDKGVKESDIVLGFVEPLLRKKEELLEV